MSEADYFKDFCSNLVISAEKRSIISARYKAITNRLNIDFWENPSEILFSLYVGSYGRNTSIKSESDIDMIFVLPAYLKTTYDNYDGNGQSALLQKVKNSILKTYPSTSIGGDGQVVFVQFADGVNFEIVPAFENSDKSYTFPDSNGGGSWKKTNPHPEIDKVQSEDANLNFNLKRLCKMARAWKSFCNVPMGGLLIDTMAYNFLKDWEYKKESFLYYDLMSRDFFEYLKNQNENQSYWYALGSNQLIYMKGKFEYKAKLAYNLSVEAIKFQNNKHYTSAKNRVVVT